MKKYLTVHEVAERFGVSTPTIWRWLKASQLPKPVKLSAGCTRWNIVIFCTGKHNVKNSLSSVQVLLFPTYLPYLSKPFFSFFKPPTQK